jgi:hypothetical protein
MDMRHGTSTTLCKPLALCALLTALLLTAGCGGPTADTADGTGTGTAVSILDGGVTFSLPDGWEEESPGNEGGGGAASVFSALYTYPSAGLALVSDGHEAPAVSVEISCSKLTGDGAQYLEVTGGNYERGLAAFPDAGQFSWKDFGGTKGYYCLFNDAGDDGLLGPWATTYLESSSGEDIVVRLLFQIHKSWYPDNEAMIPQIVDSLRIHPPYTGDVAGLD